MSTVVSLDLSKVFDSLNHTILLPKLMSSARVYCSTLKYLHKRDNKMNIYLAHGKIWVYYSFVAVTSATKTKSRHNNSNQPVLFLYIWGVIIIFKSSHSKYYSVLLRFWLKLMLIEKKNNNRRKKINYKIILVLNIVMQSWSRKTLRNVRLSSLIC